MTLMIYRTGLLYLGFKIIEEIIFNNIETKLNISKKSKTLV